MNLHQLMRDLREDNGSKIVLVVADGLGGPEGYLRYLWIHAMENEKATVIYIPTEAGLPILEAGKRKSAQ